MTIQMLWNLQAGLVTTLSTRTIVFGATNPKGQYDPDQRILLEWDLIVYMGVGQQSLFKALVILF